MATDSDIKLAEHDIKIGYIEKKLDEESRNRKEADKSLSDVQKVQGEGLKQVSTRVLVLTTVLGVGWTVVNYLPKIASLLGIG